MKLVEHILTKNPCYTAGRKITVKGLMHHMKKQARAMMLKESMVGRILVQPMMES